MCQQQQAGGKRKKRAEWKSIKKKYVPSNLSDRTDEAVIFWRILHLRKAEDGKKGHKCNSLDFGEFSNSGEDERQKFESEVAPGAQPHGKQ